jgi:membrane fusion protein, multidrug efflux system
MNRNLLYTMPFSLLLLAACGGKEKNPLESGGPKKSSTVDVVVVQPSEVVREVTIPGTVIPGEEVQLYSEVNGRIRSINFREGQVVQKGALLIQVDTDVLRAQRQQQLVDLDLAKKDEARKKILLSGKGISLEEYERSQAALASLQAQIELTNVQISKASIRAPFTGRVGLRHVSEGALISPSTMITSIVQENPVKIEFAVAERYASAVRPGQTIEFGTEKSEKKYSAQVYAYEPVIDAGTRMMTIRASLKNDGKLIPGSFVTVKYDLGKEENAFMVPAESVVPVLKGQKILVVRGGKVVEVPVEIGVRTADKVQVIGPVNSGDQVLISGLLAVKEGMPVNVNVVQK